MEPLEDNRRDVTNYLPYQLQRPTKGKRLRAIMGVENSLQKLGIKETFTSIWKDAADSEDIIVHFCAESETDRMRLKSLLASHTTQAPFKCILLKDFPRLHDGSIDISSLPPPSIEQRGRGSHNGRSNRRLQGAPISTSPPPPPVSPINSGRGGIGDHHEEQNKRLTPHPPLSSNTSSLNNAGNNNNNGGGGGGRGSGDSGWGMPSTSQMGRRLMKSKYKSENDGNNVNNVNKQRPSTVNSFDSHSQIARNLPALSPVSNEGKATVSIFHRPRPASGGTHSTSFNERSMRRSGPDDDLHINDQRILSGGAGGGGSRPMTPKGSISPKNRFNKMNGLPDVNNFSPLNAQNISQNNKIQLMRNNSITSHGTSGTSQLDMIAAQNMNLNMNQNRNSTNQSQSSQGTSTIMNFNSDSGTANTMITNRYSRWVVDGWTEKGPHHANEDRWCCTDDLFLMKQTQHQSNLARIDGGLPSSSSSSSHHIPSHNKPSSMLSSSSLLIQNTYHQPKNGIQSESKRSIQQQSKDIRKIPSGPSTSSSISSQSTVQSSSLNQNQNQMDSESKISFWACFDGHGGSTAAEYCRSNAALHIIAGLSYVYGNEFSSFPTASSKDRRGGNQHHHNQNNGQNSTNSSVASGSINIATNHEINKILDTKILGTKLIEVLEYAIANLEMGFKKYSKNDDSGCCATLVLCKQGTIAVANLGDCQCMVFDGRLLNQIGGKSTQVGHQPNQPLLKNGGGGGKSSNSSPSSSNSFGKNWRYKVNGSGDMGSSTDLGNSGDHGSRRSSFRRSFDKKNSAKQMELEQQQLEEEEEKPVNVASHELTTPHRASDPSEISRILACGGTVINGRVMGVLEPSRAIGDLDLKRIARAKHAVSIVPSVSSITLFQHTIDQQKSISMKESYHTNDNARPKSPKGLNGGGSYGKGGGGNRSSFIPISFEKLPDHPPFIVLASDGLWDFMEITHIGAIVREAHHGIRKGNRNISAAKRLMEEAKSAGSEDDITILVITFLE